MEVTVERIARAAAAIRAEAPLIHNITNYVVMNITANALLAVGASPVMAHAEEEVAEMTRIARALVLNIGTLSGPWIGAMFKAAAAAKDKGIPLVLDPVGVGATPYRNETALRIMAAYPPAIVRGNAAEIIALAGGGSETKGVDSTRTSEEALEAAEHLSGLFGCVVCVSGETDYIVDREKLFLVRNGHPLMPMVTGLGCTATALCGAFVAVEKDAAAAALGAMAVMGVAGEMAAETAAGPGSFTVYFLDALYGMSEEELQGRVKIEVVHG